MRSSAATSNQIEIGLISEPVGSAYPEPIVLTRVPASLEYGDLFFQAAQQAFAVVGVDPSQTDFYVGWEGHSALGRSLPRSVDPAAGVLKGTTPRAASPGGLSRPSALATAGSTAPDSKPLHLASYILVHDPAARRLI